MELDSQDHLLSLLMSLLPGLPTPLGRPWPSSLASNSAIQEGWTSRPELTVALSRLLGQDCSPDWCGASCTVASSNSAKGQHGKSSLAVQLFFNLPNPSPALHAQVQRWAVRRPMQTIALCSLFPFSSHYHSPLLPFYCIRLHLYAN